MIPSAVPAALVSLLHGSLLASLGHSVYAHLAPSGLALMPTWSPRAEEY